jgi:4'-phosphopantetheinyl transferase
MTDPAPASPTKLARWAAPPADPKLGAGDAHVWRLDLRRAGADVENLERLLTPAESERAAAFRFARDRDRFVVARALRRITLARYLDAPPDALAFATGPHGKPGLIGPGDAASLQFNLAHADDLALLVVARGRPVGVDLERVRDDVPIMTLAEQFFAPDEIATLRRLPAGERRIAFFACWTRKEAFLKARGDGLSRPLDRFAVSLARDEPAAIRRVDWDGDELARWLLLDLPPLPGYAAALATAAGPVRLACWDA